VGGGAKKAIARGPLRNIQIYVYIVLRLYLTIPLINYEVKCSFSKLALIKNRLRSLQIKNRLNALTIMSIENDIYKQLSFDDVLDTFASSKARKKCFT